MTTKIAQELLNIVYFLSELVLACIKIVRRPNNEEQILRPHPCESLIIRFMGREVDFFSHDAIHMNNVL